jgi:hypothetical protein
MNESPEQRLNRLARQAWECAGLARQDRDTKDELRWTKAAREYDKQLSELRSGKCEPPLFAMVEGAPMGIFEALAFQPKDMRCPECKGRIRAHKEGTNGMKAHFEHEPRFVDESKMCGQRKMGEYNWLHCCLERGHTGDHNYVVSNERK